MRKYLDCRIVIGRMKRKQIQHIFLALGLVFSFSTFFLSSSTEAASDKVKYQCPDGVMIEVIKGLEEEDKRSQCGLKDGKKIFVCPDGTKRYVDKGLPDSDLASSCNNDTADPDQADDNGEGNPGGGSSQDGPNCAILPANICAAAKNPGLQDSGTWLLLKFALNILTAGVGVVAIGAIAYAGFLYATAQDSAEQTKKAKDMIINVVIGIVAYGLMYVALNFLVPGGVFT